MPIREISDATFDSAVMSSEIPVLIDLYADWCEPCKQMAPILEEVAEEFSGQLEVFKVNTETNPMLAQAFHVRSIPMLVLFAGGRPVGQHVGALDKKGILELVAPVVGETPAAEGDRIEVTPAELDELLKSNQALAIDIRDAVSFARCHIPEAIHIDAGSLAERTQDLTPTDGRLRVLYSRSTENAQSAAEELRGLGTPITYLVGGLLHWQADGFEVRRG
jgi:thioredoxin 1